MLTEDEANTKVCPIADGAKLRGDNCIASACMAWRWGDRQPSGIGYRGDGTPHDARALGFCGLAGKP